ncbi:hypothetical protein F2Z84_08940 [Bacteroides fragilis]|uniref:Uncharacterized protein n=1 Tax=Bacteroides fragilis TaxID=817 RepID=A0A5M5XLD2_BACFG|nr:hypothetical protein F2Z30_08640 [Bacteroides fragilis]KAA5194845.1 hypothetical protein F2Z50_08935 [Bacteroides fragilis]KAA5200013.1 hypothetical protein F2Z24_11160 [Bacteroides fragilis]KAA5202659.1 hypothetical protein F2Z84_08940 [Bacteroides fragilis]KAA5209371.1 hypothetical protein F2Z25_04240 [Bacteroides fragilis]
MLTCFEVNAYLFSGKARFYRLKGAVLRQRNQPFLTSTVLVDPEKEKYESVKRRILLLFICITAETI